jgi:hypothetical protein
MGEYARYNNKLMNTAGIIIYRSTDTHMDNIDNV